MGLPMSLTMKSTACYYLLTKYSVLKIIFTGLKEFALSHDDASELKDFKHRWGTVRVKR